MSLDDGVYEYGMIMTSTAECRNVVEPIGFFTLCCFYIMNSYLHFVLYILQQHTMWIVELVVRYSSTIRANKAHKFQGQRSRSPGGRLQRPEVRQLISSEQKGLRTSKIPVHTYIHTYIQVIYNAHNVKQNG